MRRRPILPLALGLATLLLGLALTGPAAVAQTPQRGGLFKPLEPCDTAGRMQEAWRHT